MNEIKFTFNNVEEMKSFISGISVGCMPSDCGKCCQQICIGDIVPMTLTNGEEVELLAVKQERDGMIFVTYDSLSNLEKMNSNHTNEGGYEASDLRKKLNGEIIKLFPDCIRKDMIPFANGDLLRIPSEKEIFGKNEYGEEEPDDVKQWEPMKLKRNRIAFKGKNGDWEWYWLMNKMKKSAAGFACVASDGHCACNGASASYGVRPAFKLRSNNLAL